MITLSEKSTLKENFSYFNTYNLKDSCNVIDEYMKHKNISKLIKVTFGLKDKCEDGVIFHAWNWHFNDVKNNMHDLAKAGYSSIQVSPVQPIKCGNFTRTWDWWQLYQPIDFTIGNVLGTEEDFKNMCIEAKEYGIKIIVDVVTNHLANNTGKGNHAKWDRCDKIPDYLRNNDSFWENENYGAFNGNDNDRISMTHGAIGMPGLNTSNKELQKIIINFLNRLQDLGASGFRFDAAKHIELPSDPISSDYWPSIIEGLNKKSNNTFVYGEILNNCGTDIKNYSKYMKVTDNEYGWSIIDAVTNGNAGLAQNYIKADNPKNFITWVESHDTYAGDYGRKSDNVSDDIIKLGWCIVASRADSIPLFFARPKDGMNGNIGCGTSTWKDKTIVEANRFHNEFAGKSEYIRILNYNNVFEIERGNSGVVIVNLSNNYEKINTETNLKDGIYEDKLTGNMIHVENGRLYAELKGKSAIIAYNSKLKLENELSLMKMHEFLRPTHTSNEGYIYANKPDYWNNKVYAYIYNDNNEISCWPGIELKFNGDNYSYKLPKEYQNENTKIIFNDGHNQFPFAYNPGINYKNGFTILFNNNSFTYSEVKSYDLNTSKSYIV